MLWSRIADAALRGVVHVRHEPHHRVTDARDGRWPVLGRPHARLLHDLLVTDHDRPAGAHQRLRQADQPASNADGQHRGEQ